MSKEEREKIYLNPKDSRSIYYANSLNIWGDFIKAINAGVESNDGQAPFAKLNSNLSVSLFVEKSPEDPGDIYPYFEAKFAERENIIERLIKEGRVKYESDAYDILEKIPLNERPAEQKYNEMSKKEDAFKIQNAFKKCIEDPFIVGQLDYFSGKNGYKYIESEKLLDVVEHKDADLAEYRFNLSPKNLDSILKLNPKYSGYREGQGILNLSNDFTMTKDTIRLFPVQYLDGDMYLIRAAGCQMTEMTGIQLLHLLPDYDGENNPSMHHFPSEVTKKTNISHGLAEGIISNLLKTNGLRSEPLSKQGSEGDEIINFITNSKSPFKITDMGESGKNFYAMYGNTTAEDLDFCKSLEIKTSVFLAACLDEVISGEKVSDKNIKTIKKMIETAKTKEKPQEEKGFFASKEENRKGQERY